MNMSDYNNDWGSALEEEIFNAEAIDKRLMDTNLDRDTKDLIKQRLISRMQQEILHNW